jgi:hypothetical protein
VSLIAKLVTEKTSVLDWFKIRDRIDMEPSYQRKPNLWSSDKQRLLIDTILNDYDIPKIYLADFSSGSRLDNPERRLYAVIDGKQRLGAIYKFLLDELELSEHEEAPSVPRRALRGLRFSELTSRYPHLADKILKYQLSVVTVVADNPDEIQRMFVRLNFGVSVNAAERRNAKPGPVPVAIRDIAEHEFFQNRIRFTTRRSEEKNLIAKVLLFEWLGAISETKAARLDKFTDETATSDKWEDVLKLAERVKEIFDRLSLVFGEKDLLLSSSGQIPVYYWIARNYWTNQPHKLREFLGYFDDQVKRQYRGLEIQAAESSEDLSKYYQWTRTVNDRESIQGRYDMLVGRWENWRQENVVDEP